MFFKKKLSGPVLMFLVPVVVETPLNCVVKMIKCAPWGKFKEALHFVGKCGWYLTCQLLMVKYGMVRVEGEWMRLP